MGMRFWQEYRSGKAAQALQSMVQTTTAVTRQNDFGDPVTGSTAYEVCVYDAADVLVTRLWVDEAQGTCGNKPCWKAGKNGFKYKDKEAAAGGVVQKASAGSSANAVIIRA